MLRCKRERGNREQGDRIEVTRLHARVSASRLARLARLVLLYMKTGLRRLILTACKGQTMLRLTCLV